MDVGTAAVEGSGILDGNTGITGTPLAVLVLAVPARNRHTALSDVGEGKPASLLKASMVHALCLVCDWPCSIFVYDWLAGG